MRVLFDTTPFASGHKVRGMGVYTSELLNSLKKLEKKNNNFTLTDSDFDLIHYPFFDLFFHTLKPSKDKPFIVTVPDVIPLVYPKRYPPGVRGKISLLRQKNALKKASAIITISETSKKDIVRFLNLPPEKIHVTHLAPQSPNTIHRTPITHKLPKEFVLYVGDVNYNKNLLTLAKATKMAGLKLVIVGKQAVADDYDKSHIENRSLLELQTKYGKDKDIIRLGYLENDEFTSIWKKASVYCQPSLYEGFGLPVLEAMAAGLPVVASRTQALVEIAEGVAIFANPKDPDDFAQKLCMVVDNKSLHTELSKKGLKHVKKYSWQKTAEQAFEIYKKVLNE